MTDPTATPTPETPPTPVAPVAPVYQAAPQAQYAAPQANQIDPRTKPLSVLGFIGTMLVFCIPLVNIIMLFVWGFSGTTNINRRNYCRAILILALIGIVLSILMAIFLMPVLKEIFENMGWEYNYNFTY